MITFHLGRGQTSGRVVPPGLAGKLRPDEWVLVRRLPDAEAAVGDEGGAGSEPGLDDSGANADIVRYCDWREAVADMVYRVAQGDAARAWAWRRMGLVPVGAQSLNTLRAAAWRALLSESEGIWPMLTRMLHAEARCGAWTALLRAVPGTVWSELLGRAPQTRPFTLCTPRDGSGRRHAPGMFDTPGATALLAWVHAQPVLARRHGEVVAVLLAALGMPQGALVGSSVAPAPDVVLAAARRMLSAFLPHATPGLRRKWPPRGDPTHGASAAAARAAGSGDAMAMCGSVAEPVAGSVSGSAARAGSCPQGVIALRGDRCVLPLAALPAYGDWRSTNWAGLLFLLHLLPTTGVLQHPYVAAATPVFMWRLAVAVQVPDDDAAVRAFCGGWQPGDAERGTVGLLWAEADALARQTAQAWEQWLAECAPDLSLPRLAAACRRPGRIRFEPGWIEAHMPHDPVDAHMRRLTLDLDPGWVPWLGAAVRIRFE